MLGAQLPAVEVWAESDGVAAVAVAAAELVSDELVSVELVSPKLLPALDELVSVEPADELSVALELVSDTATDEASVVSALVAVAALSVLSTAVAP